MKEFIRYLRHAEARFFIKTRLGRLKKDSDPKIFGIGANKTGTTSLKAAMRAMGYSIGDQRIAENLVTDWAKRDFARIVEYCRSAQFFQDIPFSKPYTFVVLDH